MTIKQVADQLIKLCKEGKVDQVQAELFADNAVSIEANDMFGPKVTEGLAAIKQKSMHFQSMVQEFHGNDIGNPIFSENHFALQWKFDVTFKGRPRMQMEEICVYKVETGKIVLEQFFY